MNRTDISVTVIEPFAVAAVHQEKGKDVMVNAVEARGLVASGKAEFTTKDDERRAHEGGELGEPGVRTKVGPGNRAVVEHVTEDDKPGVTVDKVENPVDYAKRKRAGGDLPTDKVMIPATGKPKK